ncbi:MAG TPA: polyprenol monophosphomannose synthase [Candidatus Sulfotelmatobacter sp.]|nr:polyprenol monophosphomannose synthase [Candidatus Sulfotelmatobacter sp.]
MSPIERSVAVPPVEAPPEHSQYSGERRALRRSQAALAAASACRLNTSPELTIVIPTYNERENVAPLLQKVRAALPGTRWEVIFVDDNSPDGTADAIRAAGAEDSRIRLIQRFGKRGLSSACIEGMRQSRSRHIGVMDADLQHDERVLPAMLQEIRSGRLDMVVASRVAHGGSMGKFALHRRLLSKLGTKISRLVSRSDVTDAMSGFFVVDRRFFLEVADSLTGTGFKILLDLLASSTRPVRVTEVPYEFGVRQHGKSKLAVRVELAYLYLLADKIRSQWARRRSSHRVPI